jgi:hypothetical protein
LGRGDCCLNQPKAASQNTRAVRVSDRAVPSGARNAHPRLRPKGETRTGEAEIARQKIVRNLKARLHAFRARREAVEAAIDAMRHLKAVYGSSEIPPRYAARNCNVRMPAAGEEENLPLRPERREADLTTRTPSDGGSPHTAAAGSDGPALYAPANAG